MNYYWKTEFDWTTGSTNITTNWIYPKIATQSNNTIVSWTDWTNLNNLLDGDPTNYAECYVENLNSTIYKNTTEMLILSGFNFNISTGSTINGIEVKIVRSATMGTTGRYDPPCVTGDLVYDSLVTVNKTLSYTDVSSTNKSIPFFRGNCLNDHSGNWEDMLCVVYGSNTEKWGLSWVPSDLNSLVVKIQPYVELQAYTTACTHSEDLKVYSVVVRVSYSPSTGTTAYIQQERQYNRTSTNTIEAYKSKFNYHQCTGPNGICYSYIRNLSDIYSVSLLTGDGNCINNLYTEYNTISEYSWNFYQADLAISSNININVPYFQLDNVNIKPGWNILLWGQTAKTFNDIYTVDRNYYLKNSNILSSRASSYRARVYIKNGSAKEKQYYLLNDGNQFPVSGETKTFVEGHGYILKNQIHYDINNVATAFTYNITGQTLTQPSALLLTNYETARRMNSENASLYDLLLITNVTFGTTANYDSRASYENNSKFRISYLDNTYDIFLSGQKNITLSGTAVDAFSAYCYNTISGTTIVLPTSGFTNVSSVGDAIEMTVYDTTVPVENFHLLKYSTNIVAQTRYTVTISSLPEYIINYFETLKYWSILLKNNQFSENNMGGLINSINASPFYELLECCGSGNTLSIVPKNYYKYFDFSLLSFSQTTANTYNFSSDNQYINYKLNTFVKRFDSVKFNDNTIIYNQNYLFKGEFDVSAVTFYPPMSNTGYTSKTLAYYGRNNDVYGFKIYPKANYVNKLKYFKPFTYIDLGRLLTGLTTITDPITKITNTFISPLSPPTFRIPSAIGTGNISGRTLITEVTEDYILIEVPMTYYTTLINNMVDWVKDSDLINVSTLKDISDCLYDVYTNYTHAPYYYQQPENKRYKICGKYGEIIKDCKPLRDSFTGVFYHKNGNFNLDLFRINIDPNYRHEDPNLLYIPVEIIDIGVDKKSKMPKTLTLSNLAIPSLAVYWSYTAGTSDIEIGGRYITSFASAINKSAYKNNILEFGLNWQGLLNLGGKNLFGFASGATIYQDHPDYLRNFAFLAIHTGGTVVTSWSSVYDVNAYTSFGNTVLYNPSAIVLNSSGETYIDGYLNREISFSEQTPNHLYFSGITLVGANSGSTAKNFIYGLNSSALVISGITTILNDSAAIQMRANTINVTANTYGVHDNDTMFTGLGIDSNDHLYWIGSSNASSFLYGATTINTPYSGYTGFLIKTYFDFTYAWHTILGSTNANVLIKDVCTDSKKNSYILSECTGGTLQFGTGKTDINAINISGTTIIINKINSSGAFSWSQRATCTDTLINSKILESDGYLYVFGAFKGTMTCGSYVSTSTNNFNLYILKIKSSDGSVMPFGIIPTEIMNIGDISLDSFSDAQIYGSYIYLLGRYVQSTFVGSFIITGNANEQSYLAKIDKSTGIVSNVLPINSSGSLRAMSLQIVNSNNLYISGDFTGQVTFDKKTYNQTKKTFFVWNTNMI